jgi:hypothetical protein
MNTKLMLGLAVCAQLFGAGVAFADDAMPATDAAPMMADKMKPMMHHKMHHTMHHKMHHMAMMKHDKMMAPDAPK